MKKWVFSFLILFVVLILGLGFWLEQKRMKEKNDTLLSEIQSHYNQIVKVSKNASLYQKNNDQYEVVGLVGKDEVLELEDVSITIDTIYFPLKNSPYFVSYEDVEKGEIISYDTTYQNYVPFPYQVKTEVTNLYRDETLAYSFQNPMTFSVYLELEDRYGVEYQSQLFYLKKEDVIETTPVKALPASKGVPILNYHFFYNDDTKKYCTQIICHSEEQFESHLQYLKEENYYSLTTKDLELFLKGEIRLPEKSVMITIDDGDLGVKDIAIPLLQKYDMHGIIFVITKLVDPTQFIAPNIEVHSHSHDLHHYAYDRVGALVTYGDDYILEDLKKSREALNGSTVFCYPFYQWNDHVIELLKEAGFTMAFIGGTRDAKVKDDPMKIPRYELSSNTTLERFKQIVNPN